MQYKNAQYEKPIDLLELSADILIKWKLLLVAFFIGAAFLGVYRSVFHTETFNYNRVKDSLNANYTDHNDLQAEILANETTITAALQKIAASEELLQTQQQLKANLESTLESINDMLTQAQAVLDDPGITPEQAALIIAQLPTLTDDLAAVGSQISVTAQAMRSTQEQIADWKVEVDLLTLQNIPLKERDAELLKKIDEREALLENGSSAGPGIKSILTYMVFGGILGAVIVCGIVFLQYIMSKKLRTSAELKDQYQLPILGEFYSGDIKSCSKFERTLDKIIGNVQTMPEEKQVYELIAACIQSAADSLPVELAVTGTVSETTLQLVSDQLAALLPEKYTVTVIENPVCNIDFLINLKKYSVLLVEAKGVSDRREIDKMVEILCRNKAKVIGAVVQ